MDGRAKLLAAAGQLFAEGGYEEVSVARVLDLAGLKAPSLYHHFGDKEGLYVTWALDAIQRAGQRMIEGMALRDGARAKLTAAAEGLLQGHTVDFLLIRHDVARLRRPASVSSIEAQLDELLYRPVEVVIEAALREAQVKGPQPTEMARLFVHTIMMAHPVYRGRSDFRLSWLVEWFLEGTLDGYATPAER